METEQNALKYRYPFISESHPVGVNRLDATDCTPPGGRRVLIEDEVARVVDIAKSGVILVAPIRQKMSRHLSLNFLPFS